ncbi:MAG: hypothetical protein AAGA30_09630, partial [Planctomycetota bacterium]
YGEGIWKDAAGQELLDKGANWIWSDNQEDTAFFRFVIPGEVNTTPTPQVETDEVENEQVEVEEVTAPVVVEEEPTPVVVTDEVSPENPAPVEPNVSEVPVQPSQQTFAGDNEVELYSSTRTSSTQRQLTLDFDNGSGKYIQSGRPVNGFSPFSFTINYDSAGLPTGVTNAQIERAIRDDIEAKNSTFFPGYPWRQDASIDEISVSVDGDLADGFDITVSARFTTFDGYIDEETVEYQFDSVMATLPDHGRDLGTHVDLITVGETQTATNPIFSENGRFELIHSSDYGLVVYDRDEHLISWKLSDGAKALGQTIPEGFQATSYTLQNDRLEVSFENGEQTVFAFALASDDVQLRVTDQGGVTVTDTASDFGFSTARFGFFGMNYPEGSTVWGLDNGDLLIGNENGYFLANEDGRFNEVRLTQSGGSSTLATWGYSELASSPSDSSLTLFGGTATQLISDGTTLQVAVNQYSGDVGDVYFGVETEEAFLQQASSLTTAFRDTQNWLVFGEPNFGETRLEFFDQAEDLTYAGSYDIAGQQKTAGDDGTLPDQPIEVLAWPESNLVAVEIDGEKFLADTSSGQIVSFNVLSQSDVEGFGFAALATDSGGVVLYSLGGSENGPRLYWSDELGLQAVNDFGGSTPNRTDGGQFFAYDTDGLRQPIAVTESFVVLPDSTGQILTFLDTEGNQIGNFNLNSNSVPAVLSDGVKIVSQWNHAGEPKKIIAIENAYYLYDGSTATEIDLFSDDRGASVITSNGGAALTNQLVGGTLYQLGGQKLVTFGEQLETANRIGSAIHQGTDSGQYYRTFRNGDSTYVAPSVAVTDSQIVFKSPYESGPNQNKIFIYNQDSSYNGSYNTVTGRPTSGREPSALQIEHVWLDENGDALSRMIQVDGTYFLTDAQGEIVQVDQSFFDEVKSTFSTAGETPPIILNSEIDGSGEVAWDRDGKLGNDADGDQVDGLVYFADGNGEFEETFDWLDSDPSRRRLRNDDVLVEEFNNGYLGEIYTENPIVNGNWVTQRTLDNVQRAVQGYNIQRDTLLAFSTQGVSFYTNGVTLTRTWDELANVGVWTNLSRVAQNQVTVFPGRPPNVIVALRGSARLGFIVEAYRHAFRAIEVATGDRYLDVRNLVRQAADQQFQLAAGEIEGAAPPFARLRYILEYFGDVNSLTSQDGFFSARNLGIVREVGDRLRTLPARDEELESLAVRFEQSFSNIRNALLPLPALGADQGPDQWQTVTIDQLRTLFDLSARIGRAYAAETQ